MICKVCGKCIEKPKGFVQIDDQDYHLKCWIGKEKEGEMNNKLNCPYCGEEFKRSDFPYDHNCIPYKKDKMPEETAEYQGKKYRKLKSLAPVEVLKDIKTESEKKHFADYVAYRGDGFYRDLVDFPYFMRNKIRDNLDWLPWIISKGYIEEVRDEREEHKNKYGKWLKDNSLNDAYFFYERIWDYFDKNPVPKEGK